MEDSYRYIKLLNQDLKNSLIFYTTPEYKRLNSSVRGGVMLGSVLYNHYNNIMDVMDAAPSLNQSAVVYRGMNRRYIETKNQTFISTSFDKEVAMKFLSGRSCCLYIITLTPGQYGILPLIDVSVAPEENEVLLPPGRLSIQRIVPASENKDKVDIMYCTYLPEDAIIISTGDLNNKKIKVERLKLTVESWVERLVKSDIKSQVDLFCSEDPELFQECMDEQLKTLDYYDDIPAEAIEKFKLLFTNISEALATISK